MKLDPSVKQIWELAIANAVLRDSAIHGVSHWNRVWKTAIYLCKMEGVSSIVPQCFALIHDAQRVDDGYDRGHGRRAAELLLRHRDEFTLLSETDFESLVWSCSTHTGGTRPLGVISGICWDADRLDLGRIGIQPDPAYLSTESAKALATEGDFSALHAFFAATPDIMALAQR